MASRIERIIQSIKTNAGSETYEKVKKACEEKDVKEILDQLESTCEEKTVAQLMKPCGRQCIPKSFIERAMSVYAESAGIEDFLNRLSEVHIGGDKLYLRDGKIIGIYEKCYCTIAKKIKGLSPLFCYCAEGWYEQLFSSVFDKPVEVKKIRTILDGADECEFEISYL